MNLAAIAALGAALITSIDSVNAGQQDSRPQKKNYNFSSSVMHNCPLSDCCKGVRVEIGSLVWTYENQFEIRDTWDLKKWHPEIFQCYFKEADDFGGKVKYLSHDGAVVIAYDKNFEEWGIEPKDQCRQTIDNYADIFLKRFNPVQKQSEYGFG